MQLTREQIDMIISLMLEYSRVLGESPVDVIDSAIGVLDEMKDIEVSRSGI